MNIPPNISNNHLQQNNISLHSTPQLKPFHLLVALTSNNAKNIEIFLSKFATLPNISLLQSYKIIIFENTNNEFDIRPIISYWIYEKKQTNLQLITISEQEEILKEYPYKDIFSNESLSKKSIAFSRSLLGYYLSNIAKKIYQDNCVIWIVDDDCIPEVLTYDSTSYIPSIQQMDFLGQIALLKESDCDIALGTVTDSPPIPFISSLRTQLLDMFFNFQWFARSNPDEKYKHHQQNHLKANLEFMSYTPDFYYDLSKIEFRHLEMPFWWICIDHSPDTIVDAFLFFLDDILEFEKACNIFRPLIIDKKNFGILGEESILRGGNTLIFKPKCLELPNLSPYIEAEGKILVLRRSDFNWAITQKYLFGLKIRRVNLPLRHNRRLQNSSIISDKEKFTCDLYGMAFYHILEYLLKTSSLDSVSEEHFIQSTQLFKKNLKKIIRTIKVNNLRALTLAEKIIYFLQNPKYWWYKNIYRNKFEQKIQRALAIIQTVKYEIGKRKIQSYINKIDQHINHINEEFLKQYIEKLRLICNKMRCI